VGRDGITATNGVVIKKPTLSSGRLLLDQAVLFIEYEANST